MGDATHDFQQLSREDFRLDTYDAKSLDGVKIPLAKAGFYYTRNGLKVKCFSCSYELDASQVNPTTDILSLHKSKEPNCRFIRGLDANLSHRSKKFLSYDSLRYEKERRETFIEWPIYWLSADDLAADGFYYLRTNDHCACVFCRGIVGAWEVGDTPRGEHQRHFPHCPFIRGQPVGNVPITQSSILDRLPLDGEECPLPPPRCEYTVDETGASSGRPMAPLYASSGRHMPGSYAECKGPAKKSNINYDDIGLRQYSGPKRKDYVTKESREKSFSRWPERVVQKPSEMAEAGFFYCGLSDHVRCFHCGSGLRNWEIDDKPWEQHARWYPDCNFVLLSKGQEFIDKVRRENPPYLRSTTASKESKPRKVLASSGQFKPLNDNDLEPLMKLDIMQAISGMGFPIETIRKALRRKLEQTGLPFFSLEPCIEAVLQIMEEETRQAIQQSSDTDVEDEARARQNDKMQALNVESQTNSAVAESASTTNAAPAAVASSSSSTQSILPSTSISASAISSVSPASTGNAVAAASPIDTPAQSSTQPEAMEVDDQPETEVLVSSAPAASETQASNVPQRVIDMNEADEVISVAGELLKPARSAPPSIEMKVEGASGASLKGEPQVEDDKKASVPTTPQSQKEIADELERIRESRTCKICMDAETAIVFLPCSHMATCSSCAVAMTQCPICRVDIKYTIKPIFS